MLVYCYAKVAPNGNGLLPGWTSVFRRPGQRKLVLKIILSVYEITLLERSTLDAARVGKNAHWTIANPRF